MKLHLDKVAFEQIIDEVAKEHSIRRDVLEKDYYVTLLLLELTNIENQGYAYFKGGTALYKALRSIRRFSEDIDLTVLIEDCPNPSQAKKRLEKATLKFQSIQKGDVIENKRGSITCEYLYNSMYDLDINDVLQRFGKVKVEATSFTVSEPTTKIEIAPHLYELCNEERKSILREYYKVAPFLIETISLERIFVDKIFATEFYFERKLFADVSKHIYDIYVMLQNENIKRFILDETAFSQVVSYKRKEELARQGGIESDKRIVDFRYFYELEKTEEFESEFEKMQRIYVFDKSDVITKNDAMAAIANLLELLKAVDI